MATSTASADSVDSVGTQRCSNPRCNSRYNSLYLFTATSTLLCDECIIALMPFFITKKPYRGYGFYKIIHPPSIKSRRWCADEVDFKEGDLELLYEIDGSLSWEQNIIGVAAALEQLPADFSFFELVTMSSSTGRGPRNVTGYYFNFCHPGDWAENGGDTTFEDQAFLDFQDTSTEVKLIQVYMKMLNAYYDMDRGDAHDDTECREQVETWFRSVVFWFCNKVKELTNDSSEIELESCSKKRKLNT